MKKFLGILVLGLLWCNVGFAVCVEGDCIRGYGIFIWTAVAGDKYVGEYKNDKEHGQGTYTFADGKTDKLFLKKVN